MKNVPYRVFGNMLALRQMKTFTLALILAGSAWAQQYNAQGEILLPADYRQWVYLSTGLGMSYAETPSAHPDFDDVFVNREAYQAFLKTGAWPDKTVLVTEARTSEDDPLSKGGKFQTKIARVEMHVKDASHGGWSFYFFQPGVKSAKAFPKTANCYTCHQKNGAVDTTFVQYYPTLIDAAVKAGTFKK